LLTAEVLNVQSYAPDRRKPGSLPSMAIEPASVADALFAADQASVPAATRSEYSVGKFSTVNAGDDDTCLIVKMEEDTQISVPAIPADPTLMPPRQARDPVALVYQWKDLRMLVSAPSNG